MLFVLLELFCLLSYSKALHLYIRNSWLPMLESTVKNSSVEKLLEIVYPPGSPQRLVQTHDIIAQIKAAYRKLKENSRKNIRICGRIATIAVFHD